MDPTVALIVGIAIGVLVTFLGVAIGAGLKAKPEGDKNADQV